MVFDWFNDFYYSKNIGLQQKALGESKLTNQQLADFGQIENGEKFGFKAAVRPPMQGATESNLDMDVIKNMSRGDYKKFIKSLTEDQRGILFNNQSFTDEYKPFDFSSIYKQ